MPKIYFQHRVASYKCPCGKGHTAQTDKKLMVWMKMHSKYCQRIETTHDASSLDVKNLDSITGQELKNKIIL